MNERIKLLAEQAGITTNLDTDYYEKDMNKWIDYFSEKFAELIVAECIKEIRYKSVELLDIDFYPHYQERLKKYFGVEE